MQRRDAEIDCNRGGSGVSRASRTQRVFQDISLFRTARPHAAETQRRTFSSMSHALWREARRAGYHPTSPLRLRPSTAPYVRPPSPHAGIRTLDYRQPPTHRSVSHGSFPLSNASIVNVTHSPAEAPHALRFHTASPRSPPASHQVSPHALAVDPAKVIETT